MVEDEFIRVQDGPKDVLQRYLRTSSVLLDRVSERGGFALGRQPGEAGQVKVADDLLRVFLLRGPSWKVFASLDAVGDAAAVDEVERLRKGRL